MTDNITTHHWKATALYGPAVSNCGLPVAMAYTTNGHGFATDWATVDCPDCLAHKEQR